MKIAIDAMGGDDAPDTILKGVHLFLKEDRDTNIVLVGQEQLIKDKLKAYNIKSDRITIKHADQVIEMSDSPVKALKEKKSSSLSVMIELARNKEVDAVLTAGNTGAVVASATIRLRTLSNIDRPAIATVIPTINNYTILMDVGAVTDCKVKNLVQFGIMGSLIAEEVLGIDSPKVGLLNVGEEESKGNELAKESFQELNKAPINFYGNVEGHDIFKNTVDVVVTDGFVGNITLKSSEALAKIIFTHIKKEINNSFIYKLGALLLKKAFVKIKEKFNVEEYGGAFMIGVNGVVIKAHGSSSYKAIKNAIFLCKKMVKNNINDKISQKMENINA